MKIGFDCDGVLANFTASYHDLIIDSTGVDLFDLGDDDPPCWNAPQHRGYTDAAVNEVWTDIKASPSFWYSLKPTEHLSTLALLLPDLEHRHDIYYITSRPGVTAKRQTEAWLYRYLPYQELGLTPTVLISHDKGLAATALNLDCYIDDNKENAIGVAVDSHARSYLLDRSYNQGSLSRRNIRVHSLAEMFDRELEHL